MADDKLIITTVWGSVGRHAKIQLINLYEG